MANYSNFKRASVETAFAVGARGLERDIIGSTGGVYLPLRNAAGTLQKSTSKQTGTAATTTSPAFTTGGVTATLTKKVTITQPVHYLKAKAVGKCAASVSINATILINGSAATTSTSGTTKTTSCTTTKDMTAALTGSTNVVTARAKFIHNTSASPKCTLSIPTLSFDKQALYYPKAQ
jgi:hypothetical protein